MDIKNIFDRALSSKISAYPFSDNDTIMKNIEERAKLMENKNKRKELSTVTVKKTGAPSSSGKAPIIAGASVLAAAGIGIFVLAGHGERIFPAPLDHGIEITLPKDTTAMPEEQPESTYAFTLPQTDEPFEGYTEPVGVTLALPDCTVTVREYEFDGIIAKVRYDMTFNVDNLSEESKIFIYNRLLLIGNTTSATVNSKHSFSADGKTLHCEDSLGMFTFRPELQIIFIDTSAGAEEIERQRAEAKNSIRLMLPETPFTLSATQADCNVQIGDCTVTNVLIARRSIAVETRFDSYPVMSGEEGQHSIELVGESVNAVTEAPIKVKLSDGSEMSATVTKGGRPTSIQNDGDVMYCSFLAELSADIDPALVREIWIGDTLVYSKQDEEIVTSAYSIEVLPTQGEMGEETTFIAVDGELPLTDVIYGVPDIEASLDTTAAAPAIESDVTTTVKDIDGKPEVQFTTVTKVMTDTD